MAVNVEEPDAVTPELVEAFARLIPQLSKSSTPPNEVQLKEMVDAPGTRLLVARDDAGTIIGSLTLVLFRIPTAMRAWIEDVVVDESGRGQGVGEALSLAALDLARAAGAKTCDLTSRPKREAANRLYQRIGFHMRDTNVYRFNLE